MNIFKHLKLNKKDIEHEFLPDALEIKESPPSPAGRIIIWGICIILTVTLTWSCIAKIDESAVAHGKLIPDGKIKVIQSEYEGVIVAINVVEGQKVKAGQTLLELDPLTAKTEYEKVHDSLQIAKAEKQQLQNELSGKPNAANGLPEELRSLYANLRQARELQYQTKRETYAHNMEDAKNGQQSAEWSLKDSKRHYEIIMVEEADLRYLVKEGGLSRENYNRKERELFSAENDLETKREAVEQQHEKYLGAAKSYELVEYERQAELLNATAEKEKQIIELTSQFIKAKKALEMTKMTSPVDGEVHGLAATTIGGVVKPAEVLMTIVPENTPLIIEATADNKDIGFIDVNYPVEIKFDTYPFQRYGVVKGKVTFVSPDAIEDEKLGPVYKIKVALDLKTIPRTIEIYPGMAGTVEIKTNEKRVIDFFLDPLIKYADESLGLR